MTRIPKDTGRGLLALPRLLLGASAAVCLLPASAQAISLASPLAASIMVPYDCTPARTIEPASAGMATQADSLTAKSAAILGGQPSALDLIRQQQAGLTASADPVQAPIAAPQARAIARTTCLVRSPAIAATGAPLGRAGAIGDSFLGTARVGIRQTPFTRDWSRVSTDRLSSGRVERLLGIEAGDGVATLSQVNRWANRRIAYAEDSANWGERDYWATAEETLASGRGDCEDYAILKYQMLVALGFDRSRMYLTLARDLVRNADHAVLVVRVGERHYMLDNATDALLPAHVSYDYRPTLSFNSESAWLHGTVNRRQPLQFAYRSDNALSSALVTGRSR